MADAKKPDSKAAPKTKPVNIIADLFVIFLLFIFLYTLISSFMVRTGSDHIFSRGWSGLTGRSILLAHSRPISSLYNPIGSRVASLGSTNVLNSPGGKKIGSQKIGSRGKILQGPVVMGGVRYWYVDYDDGHDGWVKEDDIAYLESEPNLIEKTIVWFFSAINIFKILSILISLLLFLYVLNLRFKLGNLLKNEKMLLYPVSSSRVDVVNPKWEKIMSHVQSLNESDWRIAIIEADILLGELLEKLSLPGDTIGDKLKAVEKSDFRTIEDAWEAHKVRNRISHDGQTFMISQRDAKTVIGLYEKVFKEFEII